MDRSANNPKDCWPNEAETDESEQSLRRSRYTFITKQREDRSSVADSCRKAGIRQGPTRVRFTSAEGDPSAPNCNRAMALRIQHQTNAPTLPPSGGLPPSGPRKPHPATGPDAAQPAKLRGSPRCPTRPRGKSQTHAGEKVGATSNAGNKAEPLPKEPEASDRPVLMQKGF